MSIKGGSSDIQCFNHIRDEWVVILVFEHGLGISYSGSNPTKVHNPPQELLISDAHDGLAAGIELPCDGLDRLFVLAQ